MTLEEESARLKAENAALREYLREQMTALVERVRDLEARALHTLFTGSPLGSAWG